MKEITKENKLEQLLNDEENIDLKLSYSRISDFSRNPHLYCPYSCDIQDKEKHGFSGVSLPKEIRRLFFLVKHGR